MAPRKTAKPDKVSDKPPTRGKAGEHPKPQSKPRSGKRPIDKLTLAPDRDISKFPALANALVLIADDSTDRVLIKDFLTKCMVELKSKNARLKVTVPHELTTPGQCYISNWPSNDVTIWENGHIKGHMTLKEAVDAHIPACSVRPR